MGFFPEKKSEIENDLEILSKINSSIIFFISSKNLIKKNIIKKYFSDRNLVICREITKIYEEYIRLSVNNIETANIDLRGEITLVFSPILSNSAEILDESDKKKLKK